MEKRVERPYKVLTEKAVKDLRAAGYYVPEKTEAVIYTLSSEGGQQ